MKRGTTEFRARYAETDAQGIVHHSTYLVWFEVGRTELLRAAGVAYKEIEKRGYLVVVGKVAIKYHHPALYDDLIQVETRLVRSKGRLIEFGYCVTNQQGTVLATATTTHMVLDAQKKPTAMPAWMHQALAGTMNSVDKDGAT